MLFLAICTLGAWITLFGVEWLAKKNIVSPEISRKIPHIYGGIAFAISPFFISMHWVVVFGLIFLIASILVIRNDWFPGARAVDRLSWGEPFFALGVTITALLNPSDWIFMAAILHLAIADAIAALVGKSYLGRHEYKLFGHKKTLEGSAAFMVASALITYCVVLIAPSGLQASWPIVIWLPLLTTAIEAVMPLGLDNLFIPIVVVLIFNLLQVAA